MTESAEPTTPLPTKKEDDKSVMTEAGVRHGRLRPCESDFNLSRHLIPFLQDVPFYAEISRHIKKRFTTDIPTAGVTFDSKEDEIVLYVNPFFAGGGEYTDPKNEKVVCEPLTNW